MSIFSQALENESKSADELAEINWNKRKQIVYDAYENSPFYRDFYGEKGVFPNDLKHPDDWSQLPVLEKKHIRRYRDRILCRGVVEHDRITTTTGGSTGLPMLTYRDARFPEEIIKWRMLRRWNQSPAENWLMLWRMPGHAASPRSKIFNTLLWWPTRRYKFDVSSITPASLFDMERILLKKKPGIVWGYVGALQELADHLLSRKTNLDYSPLVWATASPMSRAQLEKFKRIFGPNILDQYACSEIHWVASNEPDSRELIVDSDYRHVDIVDSENSLRETPRTGDILLTDLENRVFPLVRYRNGDRARLLPERTPMSRAFPRLSPVQGRISDSIRTASGAVIPGEYLTTVFDDYYHHVDQFLIVQRKDYALNIAVRPSDRGIANPRELNSIIERVMDRLVEKIGETVEIHFEVVNELPHENGKVKFIRSELR